MNLNKLINELINHPYKEEWFEFKTNFTKDDDIGEYISALSNAASYCGRKQAYLIWGIQDKSHEIIGTTFSFYKDAENGEPLIHYLAKKIEPKIDFEFKDAHKDGKRIVILFIDKATTVPTSFDGVRYIRIGSSKDKLSKFPNKEIKLFDILKNGLPTIINTKSEYQNLTFKKLFVYFASKGVELKDETFKQNLKLLTEDGSYNIQAQLLSDNLELPIRVSIFEGKDKTSNLFSVREFGYNCLLYSLDEILRYGDVLNIIQSDESNRVVERKEVNLFESKPFREAIINAFVHNKWIEGYAPMISVFSDRIEIFSRGALPTNQTLNSFFLGESKPVNQGLADIFLKLHISEQSGRGVPQIVKSYGKEAYEFRDNSIVIKIPFNWIREVKSNIKKKEENKTLTIPRQKIIKEIENNKNVTTKELAVILNISDTAVDKNLKYLKDKGYIERKDSKKTGYWKLRSNCC